jgi:PST family polysaccharide transporter
MNPFAHANYRNAFKTVHSNIGAQHRPMTLNVMDKLSATFLAKFANHKSFIRKIFHTSWCTVANMAFGLLRNKVLALSLGPSGMGVFSLMQQMYGVMAPLTSVGGELPVVQSINSKSEENVPIFVGTVGRIYMSTLILGVLVMLGFSDHIFNAVAGDDFVKFKYLKFALCVSLIFFNLQLLTNSILSRIGLISKIQFAGVFGNFMSVIIAFLVGKLWLDCPNVVVLMLVATPLGVFIFSLFVCLNNFDARSIIKSSINFWSPSQARAILSFGGAAIAASSAGTLAQIFIIREIFLRLGAQSLGFYSTAASLAITAYIVIISFLYSYYLPSITKSTIENKRRVFTNHAVIAAVLSVGMCAFFYLFAHQLVRLLLAKTFLPAIPFIRLWMLGECLRTLAALFAIPAIAMADKWFLITTEWMWAISASAAIFISIRLNNSMIPIALIYCTLNGLYLAGSAIYSLKRGYI